MSGRIDLKPLRSGIIVLLMSFFFVVTISAQFGGGDGTAENPFQIERVHHFDEVRNYLGANHANVHFIQTADINLDVPPYNEGQGWSPIGSYSAGEHFTGNYDGNGFAITGMMVNHTTTYRGLFSSLQGATLKNIRLEDASVTASARSGIMIGRAHDSHIINCHVTGSYVGGTAQTHGGLVGECYNTTILDSGVNVEIRTRGREVGGIVGNSENSIIRNCYALGSIVAYDAWLIAFQTWGGLAGLVRTSVIPQGDAEVSNSYSLMDMDLTAGNSSSIAGFIATVSARTTITNCYAAGRITGANNGSGFTHSGNATIINSYWNTETTNFLTSTGGQPRNTIEMVYPYRGDRDVYVNWDFNDIWAHDVTGTFNGGYPYLQYQEDAAVIEPPMVNIEIVVIEEENYVRLSWEAVEGAQSYLVYMAADAYTEDWGEPITIVEASPIEIETEGDRLKFFIVTASTEPVPEP